MGKSFKINLKLSPNCYQDKNQSKMNLFFLSPALVMKCFVLSFMGKFQI